MEIKNICVVGGGRMGRQIALNAAIYGYGAAVYDVAPPFWRTCRNGRRSTWPAASPKGRMTQEQVDAIQRRFPCGGRPAKGL